MGLEIVKASPDLDLYIEWSSIVEAPTFWGTRVEMAAYLHEPKTHTDETTIAHPRAIEDRLKRADETGSSMHIRQWGCDWDDDGPIYQQQGVLPRARLAELCAVLDADGDPSSLLIPFEGNQE